jgi:hypothetical protein
MKKRNFLIAMAGISLALCVALIGCDQDGGGGGSGTSLAGTTWEGDMTTPEGRLTLQATFTARTITITQIYSDGTSSSQSPMDYTLSGNTITISGTQPWTVSGNTIIIYGNGSTFTLTKVTSGTSKPNNDDFTVTNAQVYQEDERTPYTGSGTVKIGDLTVGSVSNGKLTYTLPSSDLSSYLMDIDFFPASISVSPSTARGVFVPSWCKVVT